MTFSQLEFLYLLYCKQSGVPTAIYNCMLVDIIFVKSMVLYHWKMPTTEKKNHLENSSYTHRKLLNRADN